ncbi:MAG: type IV pilus modification protein PilV [Noviherbaspirillum sp.]
MQLIGFRSCEGKTGDWRNLQMIRLKEKGFSLIEVLVSMLVVALGVIGAAAMQMTALRTSQQSRFQTLAVQLASEMADKMRANDSQMKQGDAANPFLVVDYKSVTDGEPAAPGKLCYAAACSGGDLAAFDIYEWKKRVKAVLPGGRVLICRDSAPWDSARNALTWNCSAGTEGSASLVIKLGWQGKNPDGSLIKDADNTFPPSVALTVEPYIK